VAGSGDKSTKGPYRAWKRIGRGTREKAGHVWITTDLTSRTRKVGMFQLTPQIRVHKGESMEERSQGSRNTPKSPTETQMGDTHSGRPLRHVLKRSQLQRYANDKETTGRLGM